MGVFLDEADILPGQEASIKGLLQFQKGVAVVYQQLIVVIGQGDGTAGDGMAEMKMGISF